MKAERAVGLRRLAPSCRACRAPGHTRRVGAFARLAAASALLLAVAGACGGGSTLDADPTAEADSDSNGEWPDTLVVGAVPAEESASLRESFDGLVRVLEADLGIDVDFFEAADYAEIIEAQIDGRVHLVSYGPFSYVLATESGADIRALGALVDFAGAAPSYVSYGITRADNQSLNDLTDLGGRTVCFVDPASTSGYLYPTAGLMSVGIDPLRDIEMVFAGGHDASVLAVHDGVCDAGFSYDEMVESTLVNAGLIAPGDIKVVWKSEGIAGSPIAVLRSLPSNLQAEIKRIVLLEANSDRLAERGFCDTPQSCTLTDEDAWGWASANDALYDSVREVLSITRAYKPTNK